jgi:hypothetical protein
VVQAYVEDSEGSASGLPLACWAEVQYADKSTEWVRLDDVAGHGATAELMEVALDAVDSAIAASKANAGADGAAARLLESALASVLQRTEQDDPAADEASSTMALDAVGVSSSAVEQAAAALLPLLRGPLSCALHGASTVEYCLATRLVWSKMAKFPWWPAHQECFSYACGGQRRQQTEGAAGYVEARFCGDNSVEWCKHEDLRPFGRDWRGVIAGAAFSSPAGPVASGVAASSSASASASVSASSVMPAAAKKASSGSSAATALSSSAVAASAAGLSVQREWEPQDWKGARPLASLTDVTPVPSAGTGAGGSSGSTAQGPDALDDRSQAVVEARKEWKTARTVAALWTAAQNVRLLADPALAGVFSADATGAASGVASNTESPYAAESALYGNIASSDQSALASRFEPESFVGRWVVWWDHAYCGDELQAAPTAGARDSPPIPLPRVEYASRIFAAAELRARYGLDLREWSDRNAVDAEAGNAFVGLAAPSRSQGAVPLGFDAVVPPAILEPIGMLLSGRNDDAKLLESLTNALPDAVQSLSREVASRPHLNGLVTPPHAAGRWVLGWVVGFHASSGQHFVSFDTPLSLMGSPAQREGLEDLVCDSWNAPSDSSANGAGAYGGPIVIRRSFIDLGRCGAILLPVALPLTLVQRISAFAAGPVCSFCLGSASVADPLVVCASSDPTASFKQKDSCGNAMHPRCMVWARGPSHPLLQGRGMTAFPAKLRNGFAAAGLLLPRSEVNFARLRRLPRSTKGEHEGEEAEDARLFLPRLGVLEGAASQTSAVEALDDGQHFVAADAGTAAGGPVQDACVRQYTTRHHLARVVENDRMTEEAKEILFDHCYLTGWNCAGCRQCDACFCDTVDGPVIGKERNVSDQAFAEARMGLLADGDSRLFVQATAIPGIRGKQTVSAGVKRPGNAGPKPQLAQEEGALAGDSMEKSLDPASGGLESARPSTDVGAMTTNAVDGNYTLEHNGGINMVASATKHSPCSSKHPSPSSSVQSVYARGGGVLDLERLLIIIGASTEDQIFRTSTRLSSEGKQRAREYGIALAASFRTIFSGSSGKRGSVERPLWVESLKVKAHGELGSYARPTRTSAMWALHSYVPVPGTHIYDGRRHRALRSVKQQQKHQQDGDLKNPFGTNTSPAATAILENEPGSTPPNATVSLMLCAPCGEKMDKKCFCPVCHCTYDDDTMDMACCDGCESWIHAACDSMTGEDLRMIEEGRHPVWGKKYLCPLCRHGNMVKLISLLRSEDRLGFFALPVTPDQAPGYFNVIKEPMDMLTMARQLDLGYYDRRMGEGIQLFRSHFELIARNAIVFNTPQDRVYRDAWRILKAGTAHFATLLPMTVEDPRYKIEFERLRGAMKDNRFAGEGGAVILATLSQAEAKMDEGVRSDLSVGITSAKGVTTDECIDAVGNTGFFALSVAFPLENRGSAAGSGGRGRSGIRNSGALPISSGPAKPIVKQKATPEPLPPESTSLPLVRYDSFISEPNVDPSYAAQVFPVGGKPPFVLSEIRCSTLTAHTYSTIDICAVCGISAGSGPHLMTSCVDCGESFHLYCVSAPLVVRHAVAAARSMNLNPFNLGLTASNGLPLQQLPNPFRSPESVKALGFGGGNISQGMHLPLLRVLYSPILAASLAKVSVAWRCAGCRICIDCGLSVGDLPGPSIAELPALRSFIYCDWCHSAHHSHCVTPSPHETYRGMRSVLGQGIPPQHALDTLSHRLGNRWFCNACVSCIDCVKPSAAAPNIDKRLWSVCQEKCLKHARETPIESLMKLIGTQHVPLQCTSGTDDEVSSGICPICKHTWDDTASKNPGDGTDSGDGGGLVQCDACETWVHGRCDADFWTPDVMSVVTNFDPLAQYYCPHCRESSASVAVAAAKNMAAHVKRIQTCMKETSSTQQLAWGIWGAFESVKEDYAAALIGIMKASPGLSAPEKTQLSFATGYSDMLVNMRQMHTMARKLFAMLWQREFARTRIQTPFSLFHPSLQLNYGYRFCVPLRALDTERTTEIASETHRPTAVAPSCLPLLAELLNDCPELQGFIEGRRPVRDLSYVTPRLSYYDACTLNEDVPIDVSAVTRYSRLAAYMSPLHLAKKARFAVTVIAKKGSSIPSLHNIDSPFASNAIAEMSSQMRLTTATAYPPGQYFQVESREDEVHQALKILTTSAPCYAIAMRGRELGSLTPFAETPVSVALTSVTALRPFNRAVHDSFAIINMVRTIARRAAAATEPMATCRASEPNYVNALDTTGNLNHSAPAAEAVANDNDSRSEIGETVPKTLDIASLSDSSAVLCPLTPVRSPRIASNGLTDAFMDNTFNANSANRAEDSRVCLCCGVKGDAGLIAHIAHQTDRPSDTLYAASPNNKTSRLARSNISHAPCAPPLEGVEARLLPLHASYALSSPIGHVAIADSMDRACGGWVHLGCIVMSTDVKLIENAKAAGPPTIILHDVQKALRQARWTHCHHCGEVGATIACSRRGCPRAYHLRCALISEAALEIAPSRLARCKEHRNTDFVESDIPGLSISAAPIVQRPFPTQSDLVRWYSRGLYRSSLPALTGIALFDSSAVAIRLDAGEDGSFQVSKNEAFAGLTLPALILSEQLLPDSARGPALQEGKWDGSDGFGGFHSAEDSLSSVAVFSSDKSLRLPYPIVDSDLSLRSMASSPLSALIASRDAVTTMKSPSAFSLDHVPVIRVGSLTVLRWGRLVTRRRGFHTAGLMFPVGYRARRIWWGPVARSGDVTFVLGRCSYTLDIVDSGSPVEDSEDHIMRCLRAPTGATIGKENEPNVAGPIFLITCDSDPTLFGIGSTCDLALAAVRRELATRFAATSRFSAHFLASDEVVSTKDVHLAGSTNAPRPRTTWPGKAIETRATVCHAYATAGVVFFGLAIAAVQRALETLPEAPLLQITPNWSSAVAGTMVSPGVGVFEPAKAWWPQYRFRYIQPSIAALNDAKTKREAAVLASQTPAPSAVFIRALQRSQAAAESCLAVDLFFSDVEGIEVGSAAIAGMARGLHYDRLSRPCTLRHKRRAVMSAALPGMLDNADLSDIDKTAMGAGTSGGDLPDGIEPDSGADGQDTQTGMDIIEGCKGGVGDISATGNANGGPCKTGTGSVPEASASTVPTGTHAAATGGAPNSTAASLSGGDDAQSGENIPETGLTVMYRQLKAYTPSISERLVVRRSPIHGWGLFMKVDIPKDAMIIEYTGQVVRQAVADRREIFYEEQYRIAHEGARGVFGPDRLSIIRASKDIDETDHLRRLRFGTRNDPNMVGCDAVPPLEPDPRRVDPVTMFGVPLGGRVSDGSGGCYLFRLDDEFIVDATLKGSAARFMNHSCDPNCYSKIITVDGEKKIVIMALRELKRSEEVTYNYKFAIEMDPKMKIPCFCGASTCPGTMN